MDNDELQVSLKNNPFVPPKGTCCPVNHIPPELLSLIFEIGARSSEDEGDSEEEDEALATFWNLEEEAEDDVDEDGVTRRSKRSLTTKEDDVDEDSSSNSESSTSSDSTFELVPPFELLISHVCQHWRTVAISTPSLWTTINVSPLESAPFERVIILLERSKSLPIDIQIDCEAPDDDEDSDCSSGTKDSELDKSPQSMSFSDLDSLMSLLVPHILRWGSIEVAVASYKHMFVFLSAVSDSSIAGAPQLEALQLYHHEVQDSVTENFAHPDLVQHFKLFGGVAPRLKNVVLSGVHVDWCQGWLSCGSNLLDLELAYHTEDVRPSWIQFSGILCGAPKLERLSLCSSGPLGAPQDWFSEGSHGDYDYSGVIELHSLTELILAFHLPVYVSGLLRRLAFPSLKSLTLDFDDEDYTDIIAQLAGPSTTAVPVVPKDGEKRHSLLNGLATLKIAGLPCSDRSVELMYAELGNLKALKLSMTYLSPVFLQLLYRPCSASACQVWLPSLTTLSTADVPGNQIRELVQKRKEAGVPLKAVYMEENDKVTEYDVQWLKENLETFDLFMESDDEFEPLADIEEEHEGSESEWEEVDD